MARVVVIGAGMGGLAVAARLATLGHRVTICERADRVGGKVATVRRDGFAFDVGPSLLTLPAVYRDLFLKTGNALEESVELVGVDPAFRYRFHALDGHDPVWVDLPNVSRARTRRVLDEALGSGAGDDWDGLLERAHAVWQLTRESFLEQPLSGVRDLARLARGTTGLPGAVRTIAPWLTLRELGRRQLRDPRLRLMLDRYATYTGSDPREAPAALSVVPYVEATFGAWHVRGGLGRLAEAVHQRALDRGVDVRTTSEVCQVALDAGRARGVELADGTRLDADLVVSDADAAHLYADLLPGRDAAAIRRRLRRQAASLSGFELLLALRGRTPELAHHTVLFPQDYDAEFDGVFGRSAAPVPDPAVYLCAPDDESMHPADGQAVTVLVNAPRHGLGPGTVDWDAPGVAEGYADRVLEVMAARGVDIRDRVLWRQVRTPADLERDTRAPGGAIYGTASNGARAAFARPANRSPVPGLYLVGGSSHPGGGLPLVGLSAAIVANLIGPA